MSKAESLPFKGKASGSTLMQALRPKTISARSNDIEASEDTLGEWAENGGLQDKWPQVLSSDSWGPSRRHKRKRKNRPVTTSLKTAHKWSYFLCHRGTLVTGAEWSQGNCNQGQLWKRLTIYGEEKCQWLPFIQRFRQKDSNGVLSPLNQNKNIWYILNDLFWGQNTDC